MDNDNLNISFIGGGNMAQAIISGLVRAGHNPQCLRLSDPDPVQRESVHAIQSDIQVTDNNAAMLDTADLIVLAVKPQIMATAISTLPATAERDACVFLSIAAGTTLSSLQSWLSPEQAIVRAMPNQPALVGAGMSVLTATPTTTEEQKAWTQYVAKAMGDVAWISDESLMDAVTAVSGSGPAYFYLFMEILEACGREMGLPADLATRLARQTGFGAGCIADESELELDALRSSVTSKGGTTAAALNILEQSEFRAIVARALCAARDRSIELGKNN